MKRPKENILGSFHFNSTYGRTLFATCFVALRAATLRRTFMYACAPQPLRFAQSIKNHLGLKNRKDRGSAEWVGVVFVPCDSELCCVNPPKRCVSAVIPAEAGIFTCEATSRKPDWMTDQVRHDTRYPAACGGVVYWHSRELADFCHVSRDLRILLAMYDYLQLYLSANRLC